MVSNICSCLRQIFVSVHDNPSLLVASTKETDAAKKAKKKAKKAAQKVQEDKKGVQPFFVFLSRSVSIINVAATISEDKGLEPGPTKDDDPDGSKLLSSTNGLDKAAKFLSPLSDLTPRNIDVWITSYDVAIRRRKYSIFSMQRMV
jgi:hypothetical protein